ncbi:alkaline phosphatase [Sabulilitoribacter arenilitoris]|uniref:Alkaline phosphatase n=1 Tax=Wocania arenilitoris TaxID=2044858 RepID=A0AAE3ENT4_9FLAO|nr:alkaline phosphatase [Wocania arenilitoris]MCF7568850.1 alkaline phosphatase [Wocania arenilitoris]
MNLNQKYLSLLLLIFSIASFSQNKKVLLIGIDGLQYSEIEKAKTSNIDEFIIKRGFAGGIKGEASEQATSSGPGWITLLTGVWNDQHGITSNDGSKLSKAPSIFSFIKDHNKDANLVSISTWKEINLILKNDLYKTNFATVGGTDFLSTELMVNQITDYAPDFSFVHLDDVDHIGHSYGFGNAYTEVVEYIDSLVGDIMKAVSLRRKKHHEDWLVIIVTDHGRDSKGFSHGEQKVNQKTIFIGMNKEGNDYFMNSDDGKTLKTLKEVEALIPQTAVVPTILKHLGVPINPNWKLDGKPLID